MKCREKKGEETCGRRFLLAVEIENKHLNLM